MTDIVERLRVEAQASEDLHPDDSDIGTMREAADELAALRQENEQLRERLSDVLRICEAVRYTAGLGKQQMARVEKARAALAPAGKGSE